MSDTWIDDGDSSVSYSGTWEAVESQRSYRNTLHVTNSTNARATLTFTGISVMVYSVVRAGETPRSSYSLDGGDQTVFTGTISVITQYGVLCYTSPVLRNGQHTLTLTNLGNSTNSIFLDRFTVVSVGAVSTNSTSIGNTVISTSSTRQDTSSISESRSSTASRSSSIGISTLVTLRSSGSSNDSVPAPTPSTTQNGNMDANLGAMPPGPNNSRPTAAIIGAVAAVVIIILFSVIFVWLARRRKQQESKSWVSSSFESGGAAGPTETGSSVATTLPTEVTPQMNEQPPLYAMSEPPAYEADVGPAMVQVQGDFQPLGSRGPGLQRSGKS